MARVSLEQLVKVYPSTDKKNPAFKAVKGIDLEIHDREFMVLVGPSGCGKSTTLRMIAGLEEITTGSIKIDEQVVNDVPPKDRDIAMVFQNYALYPHMTVFENMAFGLKLRKMPRSEIESRVQEAADMLGLSELLERKPKALSGGQRQRVAVGRAIVRKPKVFLFDEPLSNLDAKMRVATRTEISRLHAQLDATMIYVTHDQVEAMTMGSRICVMKDGEIMQVAEPLELYNQPADLYVASFIGSPPMNLFTGRIVAAETGWTFEEQNASSDAIRVTLPDPLHAIAANRGDQPTVLGIRPEDITEVPTDTAAAITINLDIAEPMGAETYLYLNTGSTSFIARVAPTTTHRPGDQVSLKFESNKMHLFDAGTGRNLGPSNG
jgi:multiple sugar transport system ATP-binding protein